MNILDELQDENVIKLHKVKRAEQSNKIYTDDESIYATETLPTTTVSTSYAMRITEPTIPPIYIITNFTTRMATIPSTPVSNQTSPRVTYYGTTTSQSSTTLNTLSSYNPDICEISDFVQLSNGTCVSKPNGQMIAANILRNESNSMIDTVHALSLYISSITNSYYLLTTPYSLSVYEIDHIVDRLSNINITISSYTSFITIQQPYKGDNLTVLGALFERGIGGEIVDTSNKEILNKSFVSAAAIIDKELLNSVISLKILIIDIPTAYENIDNSTNKTLASSVIVADLQRNTSIYNSIAITLYFNPFNDYEKNDSGKYLCSFYDTNTFRWNESGCSDAHYNTEFDRFECSCNHLTSFALIWLPQSLLTTNYTKQLDAQDIASLIFQSVSIICFIAIIIHAISIRIVNPLLGIEALNLLPLISTASTTILFIFFIALGMTVYTQTSSSIETQCFLSSSVLMFIVYFFLIFMFCIKTSVGYFYYLRFVHLFPQPSHRKLLIMILISCFISLICVGLAIGFDAKSSYNITQLYPYKLCWFTRNVVYYFMIIPIGLCVLINIITIILVAKSIITHVHNAATPKQINSRMKRCVIILLSSCITQGIGWLFGPFISFVSSVAGNVLGWIFIIFNGLEGVWSIILYILIRLQRLDEQKRVSAAIELSKSSERPSNKDKQSNNNVENGEKNVQKNTKNNIEEEQPYLSNDIRKRQLIDSSSDDDYKTLN